MGRIFSQQGVMFGVLTCRMFWHMLTEWSTHPMWLAILSAANKPGQRHTDYNTGIP